MVINWSHLGLFARKFAAFYLGCATCCLLQNHFHLSPVLVSASVGLAGTFIPIPTRYDRTGIEAAIFTGSFAGMCSPVLLNGNLKILLASALGALIYILVRPHYQGFGGKLGAVAFAVSLVLFLISRIFA